MQQILFDALGNRVPLGPELGRGGEGIVFSLQSTTNYVAKLYLTPLNDDKEKKLKHMISCPTGDLTRFVAWPTTTLHERLNGPICGFVMPKFPAGASEIHQIYDIKSRLRKFPKADWAFLIHAAMNCAIAFETIHEKGHVIGDVNYNNVVVSPNATIFLIDCDSYQISLNGSIHKCKVGVPEYTPPELHNTDFDLITRTSNHDNFGLAVLIFQLLFMRHPFSGRYIGPGDQPEMSKLIQEYRFPFSKHAQQLQMEPPPNWPTLANVPPEVGGLFERAFVKQSSSTMRPSAVEWRAALDALKRTLITCTSDSSHIYYRGSSKCPWCESAAATGVEFFVTLVYAGNQLIAAVFSDRSEFIRKIMQNIESLEIADQKLTSLLQIPQVKLPRLNPIAEPPNQPTQPLAPRTPMEPPAPSCLVRDNEKKRISRLAVIGGIGLVLSTIGEALAASTFGFQPFTFIAGITIVGLGLTWFFLLIGHRFWAVKREFLREVLEHQKVLTAFRKEVSELPRRLENYKAAFTQYQQELHQYNHHLTTYLPLKAKYEERKRAYDDLAKTIDISLAEWHQLRLSTNEVLTQYRTLHSKVRSNALQISDEHKRLKPRCDEELKQLNERARDEQLKEFLEDISLRDHKIPQVGRVRLNTLMANGIMTAWQVTNERLCRVPKLGQAHDSLVIWRQAREREFKFNPESGVPVVAKTAIVRKWQRQQKSYENSLTTLLDNVRIQHKQMDENVIPSRLQRVGLIRKNLNDAFTQIHQIVNQR